MNQNYNFVRGLFSQVMNTRKEETKSSSPKKQTLLSFVTVLVTLFCFTQSNAQVTLTNPGNTTPAMSSTYTSLSLAIADVNTRTAISGPVIITLDASSPQTAPAGGYSITNTAITGGSDTNRFIFDGGGNTITAGVGANTTTDAFFKIIGADFITLQNFVMAESIGNTTATTQIEWGIALLYSSISNGAQNCTIQNNTITLNRTNPNSVGIYSNSTHSATAVTTSVTTVTSGNNNLKVYGNTISNVNLGIVVVGPTLAANTNTGIDIGGSSALTGNTITNFGTTSTGITFINVSGTINGILVRNSIGFNVSYNNITSSNGGVNAAATTLRGIFIPAASNTPTGTFTNKINNNTIALTHGFTSGTIQGVTVEATTGTATSTQNINNNNFTALQSAVATSGAITAISNVMPNLVNNFNGNTFTNITSNTTGSFTFFSNGGLTVPVNGTMSLSNNSIVTGFSKTGVGGTVTIFSTSGSSPSTVTSTYNSNNFSNISLTGATAFTGLLVQDGVAAGGPVTSIQNNTFNNITTGAGAVSVMYSGWQSPGSITTGNTITNISSSGTSILALGVTGSTSTTMNVYGNTIGNISSTGAATVIGIDLASGNFTNLNNNKIYGLTADNAAGIVNGIRISGGTTVNVYNNIVGNLFAPSTTSTSDAIRGINITTTVALSTLKLYYNTIRLNATSSGANFGSSSIFHTYSATGTTAALDLRNNIIVNASGANGTGLAVAFRRSAATDLANFATTSNNNLYFGTSGVYTDGTNTDATLAAYKTRVSTRDTNSISNNPTFASTTGSDLTYLHFAPVVNNVGIDRGAVAISGYTTDFDGNTRDVSNPDIGADEFTAVVACATYSAPADAATGQAQTGVQLTWTAAANASGYDVYFDQNTTPTTVVATNQAGITYNTGILAASTTYYWKIVPKNGAGAASCATIWSFTTPAAVPTLGTIPSAPTAVAFTNVCNNTTSAAVTFTMNGINLTGTDVTIAAPAGFTVSEDNITFSSSINVNHTSGMFTDKLIYVKFSPTTTTAYASTITISGGGLATNVDVALTGTVTESLNGLYSVGATNLAGEAGHFATLTAALTAYNSYCLTGPVVFSLTDTSYSSAETFPIVVNANTLASAINTLTIKPATGVVTSITGSSTAAIIKLNGADYVILDGSNANATDKSLTIANTNTGTSSAVVWMASIATPLNGATNNTVKNCIITGNAPATTLAGVITSGTTITAVADAGNTNNTIQNNLITAAYYGVGMAGSAAGDASNSILNNTIGSSVAASKIGLNGVFISNQTGVNISSNTVVGVTASGNVNLAGIYVGGLTTGGSISKNKISNVLNATTRQAYGIQLNSTSTTSGLTLDNNMIYDVINIGGNATVTRGAHGIALVTGGGYKIYNNTVNMNTTAASATITTSALYITSGVVGLDIRNNIFANPQTQGTRYAIYDATATNAAYTTIDYNNYSCAGTALGNINAIDRTDLAAIVTGFGQNANSKAITPNFVSATDMHMNLGTNFAFENLATPIAGITTDIDGEVRSGSTPDIGADEFTTLDCTTQTLTAGTVSATNPALCGTGSTTITATGYTIGINTTYEWESATDMAFTTPVSMGAASATYTNLATGIITTTTYYRLKAICSGTTMAYATPIAVVVNTPAVTTVSAAVTICNGTSTPLTAAGSSNYAWSPATGLSVTTGTSVTASPTATTTYTVTGTDANGCSTTATVVVTVNPTPSAIIIAPPAAICSGGTATLSSSGGNVTSAGTVVIGSATTLTAAATTEPTAFNNRYKHYWMQMVFTPSELSAAGLSAGNISAVKFNITTLGDASNVTDLKVRMGNAASGTLTTFQSTGLTLVKTAATYSYIVGENTITFDTPYTWDGTSNLIFDLRSTGADNLNNAITYYTATTGNTVATATTSTVSTSDGFAATIPTATLSTKRLNTQFVGVISAPGSIIWSPTTDLYTDAAATTAYTGTAAAVVYAKLTAPATYTATSTLGSCSVSTPVTVTPNPLPTITLDATTPVCNGGTSSSLSYTATTGTPTQYTIDFNAAAELAGFADVPYTTLTSPIALSVLTGATPGTYTGTITVKNANGCISATPQTFTVVINTPVAITTQPSNSVSLENSNASFTVAASGSGLTYQWQESTDNGVTWNNIIGATSATYTALSVSNSMNGYNYKCIVSGAAPCTSVTSNVVSLTISTTAIATQPVSTTICSNGTATFTIATSGTPPTYQWQVSTNNGTLWSDIVGETTTTLTVSGLTAATSQRYRCVLSGLINSDAAILTVNDIVAITTQPSDVTVCSNAANATFTTAATGTGLTYQWQQRANSSGTWANVGTGTTGGTTATLTIATLTPGLDGYQYQCIVTGTAPCVSPTPTTATLSVTGYTIVNSASNNNNNICNGGSVTFTATPTASSPAITYSWICATAGSGATTAVTGSSAIITPTQLGTYTYTLTATDGSCSFTSTQTITVNTLPVITTATANPNVACVGSTINLAATIVGIGAGTATVGTGTSLTGDWDYVTAFNNRWPSYRMQMVFTAAELQAAGLSAGNITSMAFKIATLGSAATNPATVIKIGTSSVSALTTTFESTTGYTTVYPSQTYTHTASGIQTIPFSTPFVWNGTSNIIIDMLQNGADASNNSQTYYSVTTANTVACTSVSSTATITAYNTRPNVVFGGQALANVTSSYNWSWNSTPAITTAAGTTVLPTGATTTYTVTATNPTTGCSATQDVTVSTAVSALALTGVTPASSNVCVGGSVTLTGAPTGGCIPYLYSWSDGTTVVGTTASISVSPTSTKTYTLTVTDNGGVIVTGSSTITVNNPQPTSVAGETKCATSATFALGATVSNANNLLNWYAGPTGGSALASGATFTTPSLSATTTYYVEERSLDPIINNIGLDNTAVPSSTGASSERGILFTATKAFTLLSAEYYSPTTSVSNTVIVRLVDNVSGTQIATRTIIVPQGASASWYTMNIGFDIVPGTYRLLASFSQSVNRSISGFTYPYTLGALGTITSGYDSGVSSTTYSYFHNINIQEFCTGVRVPVTATLNTPPVLILGSSTATICSGQSTTSAVAVTSLASSFNTYTWSPSPTSVSGDEITGWIFSPSVSTTYTLTASDGTCSNTATFAVTVNPLPTTVTIAPTSASVCVDTVLPLVATGGTISSSYNFIENFNGATMPAGWVTYSPTTTSAVIISASANAGGTANELGLSFTNATTTETDTYYASMPVFNASALNSLQLNFKYLLSNYSATTYPYVFKVQTSSDNTNWSDAFTFTPSGGTAYTAQNQTVSLSGLQGISTAYVRFAVIGRVFGCNYVAIDDVNVTGIGSVPTATTWTPIANLYTDLAATTPYTLGTSATTVYFKSSTVAAAATYTATATSVAGCTSTATVPVTVNANTTLALTSANATQTVCEGTAIANIVYTVTNGTGVTATLPSGLSGALVGNTYTISGIPTAAGAISVIGTGLCTASAALTGVITINTTATPTGLAIQDSCLGTIADFIVSGDIGAVFTWYATNTSTVAISSTTPAVLNTSYYVSQMVNGCEGPRLEVTASGPCLGKEEFDLASFSYYPNPTSDIVNISYSKEITHVKVFNMIGQQFLNKDINATTTQIDMSGYANGAYFIQVSTENAMKTVRVIKK